MFKIGVGTYSTSARAMEYVTEVLQSGRLSYGPFSAALEGKFAALHSSSYGVLSNSGTSSLLVALQTMKDVHGWQDGDEVIVPALTFVATVNIVLQSGMVPVLVDVDMRTYNINPNLIENAITERTRCIIPVHLFGQPANMVAIKVIADKHDLKIIEDSCECMFATIDGQPVGSWGDIACFSFYVAHLITSGVGGIALTRDREYAEVMRSLVNHGRNIAYFHPDAEQREWVRRVRFEFTRIGHSFRITELEAAIALAQLDDDPYTMIVQRNYHASVLSKGLQHFKDLQLPTKHYLASHSYMMYPIVVKGDIKWELCAFLEKRGIETREMLPLTNQPVYADLFKEEDYPIARWINRSGFYIGCHQDLTDEDLIYIINTFKEYFG